MRITPREKDMAWNLIKNVRNINCTEFIETYQAY